MGGGDDTIIFPTPPGTHFPHFYSRSNDLNVGYGDGWDTCQLVNGPIIVVWTIVVMSVVVVMTGRRGIGCPHAECGQRARAIVGEV